MKKTALIIFLILYLFALYLWTLPINEMPFGDVDSSVHFTSGDYMAQTDKSVYRLPYYLSYTIGKDTGGYFAYPPQFNTGEAISQVVGGHRIISVYLFIAILCSSFILSSYLLIRKLYGFIPALLTSFLLIFSRRDIMYYLWGLWPQTIAFSFVPLIIYCYYTFIDLQTNETERKHLKYLYLTIILIALQYTFHPQAFFFSVAFIFVYSLVVTILKRKLPFRIKDIIPSLIILIIFVFLLAPFQFTVTLGNLGLIDKGIDKESYFKFQPQNIGRLSHWFKIDEEYFGSVPQNYFLYSYVYGGYWTLPLLFLGLGFLVVRRKKQDILMLSWLLTLYLFIHMEIIGGDRNFRFLQLEAQLFSSVIAVGLISIISFIKLPIEQKRYLKYGLVILFIIAGLYFNAKPVYSELSNSYKGIYRITKSEYDATVWMRENLPEDADVLLIGTVAYNKKKWLQGLSYRHLLYDNNIITQSDQGIELTNHVLIDYSDLVALGRHDVIKQIEEWEINNLTNATLMYDRNYVKVYKVETKT